MALLEVEEFECLLEHGGVAVEAILCLWEETIPLEELDVTLVF